VAFVPPVFDADQTNEHAIVGIACPASALGPTAAEILQRNETTRVATATVSYAAGLETIDLETIEQKLFSRGVTS